jgi:predicted esterase
LDRTLPTPTHGRYLVEIPEHSRATLVGFHGYQENAAIHLEVLRRIALSAEARSAKVDAGRSIGLVSVQALHRFYTRSNEVVVASWMTREDRELAIADNVAYVGNVLAAVAEEFGLTRPLIYVGFSQGVAMAYRSAVLVQRPCDGLIVLAADVPPDVAPLASSLPRILMGRGTTDQWYTADKAAADLAILKPAGVAVVEEVFADGHVWAPSFISRAGQFVDELLS